ncbi:MAG: hypothetical protein V5B36_11090 [Candidatus Accumulibacter sp. UW25]|jgi:hypothetical protein
MPETLARCPACRARLGEDAVCPRCGCDFALVRQAIAQADRLLEQSLRSLLQGDRAAARRQVEASLANRRQRLAEAIQAFLGDDPNDPQDRHGLPDEPGAESSQPRSGAVAAEDDWRHGSPQPLDVAEVQG